MTHAASHILVADIGGTNSRFALFGVSKSTPNPMVTAPTAPVTISLVRQVHFPTQNFANTSELLATLAQYATPDGDYFLPLSPKAVPISAAVIALPGPTRNASPRVPQPEGETCFCPNIPWPISHTELVAGLGIQDVWLLNDFVAQGFACALLPEILHAATIVQGEDHALGPLALIGAGTGLGQCTVTIDGAPEVLPSEGGHSLFPFTGNDEFAFAAYLAQKYNTTALVKDMVVSGQGFADLFAFHAGYVCPPEDAATALHEHPVVLEWFARFYARACRDLMLTVLPLGGLYITGGMASYLPGLLDHPAFVTTLHDMKPMEKVLRRIPVKHIRTHNAGLWGAAAFAMQCLHPGQTITAAQ